MQGQGQGQAQGASAPHPRPLCSSCSTPLPELHVYGSHLPSPLLTAPLPPGMRLCGFAPPPQPRTRGRYRCFLAPLRFGAGVKGKLLDAAAAGTPVVGTAVAWEDVALPEGRKDGAEGEGGGDDGAVGKWVSMYAGPYTDTPTSTSPHYSPSFAAAAAAPVDDLLVAFPERAAELYESQAAWEAARAHGKRLIQEGYGDEAAREGLRQALLGVGFVPVDCGEGKGKGTSGMLRAPTPSDVAALRGGDLIGQMLWRDAHRAVDARSKVLEVRKMVREALATVAK